MKKVYTQRKYLRCQKYGMLIVDLIMLEVLISHRVKIKIILLLDRLTTFIKSQMKQSRLGQKF